MLQVLGIKNCSTIKKTLKWLDGKELEYDFRDVKKMPLEEDELKSLSLRVGIDVLANKRGMKWRTLELKDQELSDEDLFKLLLEHQTMIKRPVVLYGDAVMVGFDEESMQTFINEHLNEE